jgi:hypothetical protein
MTAAPTIPAAPNEAACVAPPLVDGLVVGVAAPDAVVLPAEVDGAVEEAFDAEGVVVVPVDFETETEVVEVTLPVVLVTLAVPLVEETALVEEAELEDRLFLPMQEVSVPELIVKAAD